MFLYVTMAAPSRIWLKILDTINNDKDIMDTIEAYAVVLWPLQL